MKYLNKLINDLRTRYKYCYSKYSVDYGSHCLSTKIKHGCIAKRCIVEEIAKLNENQKYIYNKLLKNANK